jgi:hypothetical protein
MGMSEGDWIRQMKDEELAHYISNGMTCVFCPAKLKSCFRQNRGCKEAWLHHLKSKRHVYDETERPTTSNKFQWLFLALSVISGSVAITVVVSWIFNICTK